MSREEEDFRIDFYIWYKLREIRSELDFASHMDTPEYRSLSQSIIRWANYMKSDSLSHKERLIQIKDWIPPRYSKKITLIILYRSWNIDVGLREAKHWIEKEVLNNG